MKLAIGCIITSILLNQIPNLFEGPTSWYIYSSVKQFELSMWLIFAVSLISYKQLVLKSVLAVWAVTDFVDAFNPLLWELFGNWLFPIHAIKAIIATIWVLFIWFRSYDRENDPLDTEHFFLVGVRPTGLQDFILSLIKEPHGGSGIYANGNFYHYRHGQLKIHTLEYLIRAQNKYRIRKIRKIDPTRLSQLNNLLYTKYKKWSLINNCKTVLEPILWERGKPLF